VRAKKIAEAGRSGRQSLPRIRIPFVILKGKLFDTHGVASTWTMRYAASIGDPRPLAGERGWI
jgi:hypothetical protein